ncbi:MAG TPA: hypothetical protein VF686_05135, partial [Brevundimonas sp.]
MVSKLRRGVLIILWFWFASVLATAQTISPPQTIEPAASNEQVLREDSGFSPATKRTATRGAAAFRAPSLETVIQGLGVFVAAAAAVFSAISARGSVAAANEMRQARRDATKPRLSYRVLDR